MPFTDIIGHIANFGFLYGAWALGKKRVSGWIAQALANVLYVIQSYHMANIPLLVVSIVLIGVNIYGYWSWTKKESKSVLQKSIQDAELKRSQAIMDMYNEGIL